MVAYKEELKLDTAEVDASIEAVFEYRNMLDKLQADDLPRFEARFKELLSEQDRRWTGQGHLAPLLLCLCRQRARARGPPRALRIDTLDDALALIGERRDASRFGTLLEFIEAQRSVLGELLDLVLPLAALDSQAAGASQFARRYGFRDKTQRIRSSSPNEACAEAKGKSELSALFATSRSSRACVNPLGRAGLSRTQLVTPGVLNVPLFLA